MLKRLFAFLLLCALVVPAAAMPLCDAEEETQTAQSGHMGHGKADKSGPKKTQDEKHGCLACSAPLDRDAFDMPQPYWHAMVVNHAPSPGLSGLIPAPEPPPPRT